MKIKNFTQSKINWIAASILIAAMIIVKPGFSQDNAYHFYTIDTTEQYPAVGFCGVYNYLWDQGVIDSEGNIHFVYVHNYKLFCYSSADNGVTWTAEQVITGKEGKIRTAQMGLAPGDKKLIVYSVNTGFTSSGTVPYFSEFIYDAYGIVKEESGWVNHTLFTHTTNNGLLPFGIITDNDGIVHVILSKYGWYLYGGELYEATYLSETQAWTNPALIRSYTDRPIDNAIHYLGKTALAADGSILCIYQRIGSITGTTNVEVLVKLTEGWQVPVVILQNNSYSTYNRFDIDNDDLGNYCVGYFEPWGDNGPEIHLAKNTIDSFEKFEIFQSTDTLLKMSIHSQDDGSSILYCNFKHSYPKILKFKDNLLTESATMPYFPQEDSVNVMKYLYPIPNKANFSDKKDFYGFTNIYFGKAGNDVLPFYLLFATFKITQDFTWIPQNDLSDSELSIYPNPVGDILRIDVNTVSGSKTLSIYNYLGKLVQRQKLSEEINVAHLPVGMYILQIDESEESIKFIKR